MARRPKSLSALRSWLQAKAANFLNCFGVPPLRKSAKLWPLRMERAANLPPGRDEYLFIMLILAELMLRFSLGGMFLPSYIVQSRSSRDCQVLLKDLVGLKN